MTKLAIFSRCVCSAISIGKINNEEWTIDEIVFMCGVMKDEYGWNPIDTINIILEKYKNGGLSPDMHAWCKRYIKYNNRS